MHKRRDGIVITDTAKTSFFDAMEKVGKAAKVDPGESWTDGHNALATLWALQEAKSDGIRIQLILLSANASARRQEFANRGIGTDVASSVNDLLNLAKPTK